MMFFRDSLFALLSAVAMLAPGGPSSRKPVSGAPLLHEWRLVDGHSWQIAAEAKETAAATDAREGTRGACSEGMVEVTGRMKEAAGWVSIDELQKGACLRWLGGRSPARCARYDADEWRRVSRALPTRPMHFCIDRFEYPNERGAYPVVDVTWTEAVALCVGEHKRLCSEDEWTFACEGAEATPYPGGYERDRNAYVIDRAWRAVDYGALRERTTARAEREIDRLWNGAASGARPEGRSSFGVYDLTGNVDEWTTSVNPHERPSILKGGYWGPIRARCRPATRAHGLGYSNYQQGLRCCADASHGDGE